MRRSMRLVAALLVVGAVGFGASAAFGTTGNSTAGSLNFSVSTPDAATAGQTIAWSASIANGSQVAPVNAQVTFNISGPGISKTSITWLAHFAPNASLNRSGSFRIPTKAAAGDYTVTMSVNAGPAGSGQASATTTVS